MRPLDLSILKIQKQLNNYKETTVSKNYELPLDKSNETWFEEKLRGFYGMRYRIKESLFSKKSDFQTVDVIETYGHGKMLFNDGLAMVSERDEFIYHDMIAHVPLFVHPNPKRVLVIGGGDGGTAREVLRHQNVEECVMVEIDNVVVDACKKHIQKTACVFNHPKLTLIIADAVKWVSDNQEQKFDVILVDSTDPIGPAQPLFSKEFYGELSQLLTENGIVVSQGESPFYEVAAQRSLLNILKSQFSFATFYNFHNLTYPGGLWSFSFASKGLHPINDFNEARVSESELSFGYYNIETHRAAFAMPEFMKKNLEGLLTK